MRLFACLALPLLAVSAQAVEMLPQLPPPPQTGPEKLDDGTYRIGSILVDKARQQFTVRARVAHLGKPLEYLAVAYQGQKDYESLLQIDATATQFQLASILIGLDDEKSVKPRYQFDEREAAGQPLAIVLEWEHDGKSHTISAAEALLADGKTPGADEWVYIGSVTEANGQFAAEAVGSLISFVHDPLAVIDHRSGIGIGHYGAITGNTSRLPPVGALVTVRVSVIDEQSVGRNEEQD